MNELAEIQKAKRELLEMCAKKDVAIRQGDWLFHKETDRAFCVQVFHGDKMLPDGSNAWLMPMKAEQCPIQMEDLFSPEIEKKFMEADFS